MKQLIQNVIKEFQINTLVKVRVLKLMVGVLMSQKILRQVGNIETDLIVIKTMMRQKSTAGNYLKFMTN